VPTAFRHPRTLAIGAWTLAFALFVSSQGFPTKRSIVLVWITLAILAIGIARPRSTMRAMVTTWLPLFAALVAYDLLRGLSDPNRMSAATWPQLDLDLWLGGGRTPTERLQGWLWTPGTPHVWDYAVWGVYQSHFLVPLLLAVFLWGIGHRLATPYLLGIAALSWCALATYFLYPAQPPWMTARDGLTHGDIVRVVQQMWHDVGVARAERVFTTARADGSKYSNPVAALPSLHAAFPMFIALMLRGIDRRLTVLLGAYTLAMGFSLVYAGEHFTFDVLLGWAYAVVVSTVVLRYQSSAARTSPAMAAPHSSPIGIAGSESPVVASSAPRSR
jgi:hypothetical protein